MDEVKKPKGSTKTNFNDPVAAASYWAWAKNQKPAGPTARTIKALKEGQQVTLITDRQKKD
jgi:hypothetical protein